MKKRGEGRKLPLFYFLPSVKNKGKVKTQIRRGSAAKNESLSAPQLAAALLLQLKIRSRAAAGCGAERLRGFAFPEGEEGFQAPQPAVAKQALGFAQNLRF